MADSSLPDDAAVAAADCMPRSIQSAQRCRPTEGSLSLSLSLSWGASSRRAGSGQSVPSSPSLPRLVVPSLPLLLLGSGHLGISPGVSVGQPCPSFSVHAHVCMHVQHTYARMDRVPSVWLFSPSTRAHHGRVAAPAGPPSPSPSYTHLGRRAAAKTERPSITRIKRLVLRLASLSVHSHASPCLSA